MSNTNLILNRKDRRSIYRIRGEKVILYRDPAELYSVPTGALEQACGAVVSVFEEILCFG
jgi:hypothetical protein